MIFRAKHYQWPFEIPPKQQILVFGLVSGREDCIWGGFSLNFCTFERNLSLSNFWFFRNLSLNWKFAEIKVFFLLQYKMNSYLKCLAKWPWILNAILQSMHLKGLGFDVDGAPKVALMLTLLKWPTDLLCFWRWPLDLKK